jgi:hypothetical protein
LIKNEDGPAENRLEPKVNRAGRTKNRLEPKVNRAGRAKNHFERLFDVDHFVCLVCKFHKKEKSLLNYISSTSVQLTAIRN